MEDGPPIVVVIKLLLGLVALSIGAFFSAAEVGLLGVGRIQIRKLASAGNKRALLIQRLLLDPLKLIATLIIAITTHLYIAEAFATHAALDLVGERKELIQPIIVVGFALFALIVADLAPAIYGVSNPQRIALLAAIPVKVARFILSPLIVVVTSISNILLRILRSDPHAHYPLITEQELLALIKMAEEQGTITGEERRMLWSAIEFSDVTVSEIMVRRRDMVCVPAKMRLEDAVRKMVECGHSRLPVYSGELDNIIGILHAKDALLAWHSGKLDIPVESICREALFVAETQRAYTVLETMQRTRKSMAIALDEEGNVAGLVTVEDLIEVIFGEIHDEWDVAQKFIQRLDDGSYLVEARLSLREIEKLLDIELPEEEYDTLAELVYELLERIPRVGDSLTVGNVRLEVVEMEGKRIKWLKLTRLGELNGKNMTEQ